MKLVLLASLVQISLLSSAVALMPLTGTPAKIIARIGECRLYRSHALSRSECQCRVYYQLALPLTTDVKIE